MCVRYVFVTVFILSATLPCVTIPVQAGDWPQILGPHRNGVAENETLADAWPADGPPIVWQRDVGSGFAGAAVAEGNAVVFHRRGDEDIAECFSAATGKLQWRTTLPAKYVPSYTDDNGPRCVPLIAGPHVFLYGARGLLACVELRTGKKLWSRDTFEEFNSQRPFRGEPPEGYFGIGTAPILVDGKLLVNIGGDSKAAGIVAFDPQTGKTLWQSTSERASYSSPIAATINGRQHVIFATRLKIVSINPQDGSTRFTMPFGRTGPAVTGANPVVMGDHLFVTGSYNFGAVWAEITAAGLNEKWSSDEILSSQYTTSIPHEGKLFGVHGRQDIGRAELRCIDPQAESVLWSEEEFGYATLIKADGKLLILKTNGELHLAAVDVKQYRELARAQILTNTTRALPALSNGLLYVRDTGTLKCIDLRPRE